MTQGLNRPPPCKNDHTYSETSGSHKDDGLKNGLDNVNLASAPNSAPRIPTVALPMQEEQDETCLKAIFSEPEQDTVYSDLILSEPLAIEGLSIDGFWPTGLLWS